VDAGTSKLASLPLVSSPGDARRGRELVARLDGREREVLALIADGARNRKWRRSCSSPHTVNAHAANIIRKPEANTREVSAIWTLARFDDPASCRVPRTG